MAALLEKYDEILEALLEALTDHYGSRLVSCAVFGSVGRRTPRWGSDVDVLLVVDGLPRGRMKRVEEFLPVEARLEPVLRDVPDPKTAPELSPIIKSREEVDARPLILLDMVEDARILHDPEGFLAGALDRLRRRLQELGSRRVRRGNAWHWVLKPDLQPGEVFEL